MRKYVELEKEDIEKLIAIHYGAISVSIEVNEEPTGYEVYALAVLEEAGVENGK